MTEGGRLSDELNWQIRFFEYELEHGFMFEGKLSSEYIEEAVSNYQILLKESMKEQPRFPEEMKRKPESWQVRKLISHLKQNDRTSQLDLDVYDGNETVCQRLKDFEMRSVDRMRVFLTKRGHITRIENDRQEQSSQLAHTNRSM